MSLLGIGPLELVFILLVAIILIGPRDLGRVARSAGQVLRRIYRSEAWQALTQMSRSLRNLPDTLAREAELDELTDIQRTAASVKEDLVRDMDPLRQDIRALDESIEHAPSSPVPPPHPNTSTDSSDTTP